MKNIKMLWIAALAVPQLTALPLVTLAGDTDQGNDAKNTVQATQPEEKGPPLPLHTIEAQGAS